MDRELKRASLYLVQASQSIPTGELARACAHLERVSRLLQLLLATVWERSTDLDFERPEIFMTRYLNEMNVPHSSDSQMEFLAVTSEAQ